MKLRVEVEWKDKQGRCWQLTCTGVDGIVRRNRRLRICWDAYFAVPLFAVGRPWSSGGWWHGEELRQFVDVTFSAVNSFAAWPCNDDEPHCSEDLLVSLP